MAIKKNTAAVLENTQEITEHTISQEDAANIERRQYSRRMARWPVIITMKNKQTINAKTQDVSEKGASVKSPIHFEKGEMIFIHINTIYQGKKKSLKLVSEVKHCAISRDEFTLGLYFKKAADDTFLFLRKYSENKL